MLAEDRTARKTLMTNCLSRRHRSAAQSQVRIGSAARCAERPNQPISGCACTAERSSASSPRCALHAAGCVVDVISADPVFGLGAWVQGGGVRACHALDHVGKDGAGCQLLLSCLDSHIYCCECSDYLYPRELSGSGRLAAVCMRWSPIASSLRLKPSSHVPPR